MFTAARNTLKQFQNKEDGSVALVFTLASVAIIGIAGLAIDFGRTIDANTKISAALDSAALAAARGLRLENLTDTEVTARATTYVNDNLASSGARFYTINTINVTIDRANSAVQINVDGIVPTTFAGIVGVTSMPLTKSAVAIFDAKDIEVALQLDTTGSMSSPSGSGNSKIQDLRIATVELIDALIPDTTTPNSIRIGIAPFTSGVNAGAYAHAVDANRAAPGGCVYERTTPAKQFTDDAASGTGSLKIRTDLAAGAGGCPTVPVVALTNNKTTLKATANALNANGSTAGHLGTAWAWYLISPVWQSVWNLTKPAAAYNDGTTTKIAVLMTDGEYNTVGGIQSNANLAAGSSMAVSTCDAMKADGIIIYTVGFKLTDPTAIATLGACASNPATFLRAEDGNQLRGAFNTIATSILTLRLSM